MTHRAVRAVGAVVLAAALVAGSALAQEDGGSPKVPAARTLARAFTVTTAFPLATHRVLDVDGDARDDLLAIGRNGEVRVWHHDVKSGRLAEQPSGVLVLPEPERSVLSIADVLGRGGPPQLAVLSRRGLEAYPVGPDGAFARMPILVSREAAFSLRVGRPTFADVLRDVNGDGHPDLLLPRGETCELWLWNAPAAPASPGAAEGALPTYRSVGAFKVDVTRDRATEAGALSDVLETSFRIPSLAFEDVNGDGRKDLLVEDGKFRSFHLAKGDGRISSDPDVRLDLAKFQDTTPEAEVKLGRTLAGGDDQRFVGMDLDGDGIRDYVIAHRRKVWVFRGTPAGPQFTDTTQILRVADDLSAMVVTRLDGDPHADLMLLRVQVPTIATLLRGLVASWDVDIGAIGYENDGTGKFATSPKWKGDLALRLPAILGVLKDPDALVRRFEGLASKFKRGFVWGDFDGDGHDDAAVASGEERRLDVWFGLHRDGGGAPGSNGSGGSGANGSGGAYGGDAEGDAALGNAFFGEDKVWDLDRVIQWLGDFADRRFARITGSRAPSQRIALRKAGEADYEGASGAAFDGGGTKSIVLAYTDEAGRGVFDVWR